MINRDRMSEAEWMQRLTNLRNRLERDADNVYDLSYMAESGPWDSYADKACRRCIADKGEQNQLLEIADLMIRAQKMLSQVIDNHHAEA